MLKKQDRRLRFETLDRREVMSATIFESEPNDTKRTADPVLLDTADNAAEVRGTVASRNDEDFFRYRPTATGTLNLAISDGPTLAAKISVEDSTGKKLFESEPRNGIASGSFSVTAGKDIYIRVRGQNKSTGDYALQLSLNEPVTPPTTPPVTPPVSPPVVPPIGTTGSILVERESNNTKSTANRADLGPTLQIQGTSTKRDDDFFALKATTSGTVQIATSSGNVKLSVEDARGNKLFESEPNDGITSGSFTAVAGTTYYLRIRGMSAALDPYLVDLALS